MTFIISRPETSSLEIPFIKKNETELPKKKLTFFNTTTQKNEDFTFYDYVGHLEKFGYEWSKAGFKYKITIKDNKIIKKLTLEKQQRIDFNIDESRMYHLDKPNGNFYNLITFTMGYFEDIKILKKKFNITKNFDFTTSTPFKKNKSLNHYSELRRHRHLPNTRRNDNLYSSYFRRYTLLLRDSNLKIKFFRKILSNLYVSKFFHDERQINLSR